MGKVICVANQKGGVGKTTTCVNLGTALAKNGKKVCLIDLDPQGNLTQSLGYRNPDEMEWTVAEVLREEIELCNSLSRREQCFSDGCSNTGGFEKKKDLSRNDREAYDKLSHQQLLHDKLSLQQRHYDKLSRSASWNSDGAYHSEGTVQSDDSEIQDRELSDKLSQCETGDYSKDNHPSENTKIKTGDRDDQELHDKLSPVLQRTILHHEEGMDLVPGNIELAGLEVSMVNLMSRELYLKMAIQELREEYDYILIDCMPSLGMLTINALAASDCIITPVQAAYLPAKGLEQFLLTVSKVRRQINRGLKMEGILLAMVDTRTNNAKEIISLIYEAYGTHVRIFQSQIPFSVRAAEASASGCSIFAYDPHGKVAASYRKLSEEVTGDAR